MALAGSSSEAQDSASSVDVIIGRVAATKTANDDVRKSSVSRR